jgi:hypothetical protein
MTGEDRYIWRFRYQLQFNIHISSIGQKGTAVLLNIGDEIFLNAGKEIVYNVLDQNRFVVGPAIRFPSGWQAGLAYNFQFGVANVPSTYLKSNIFWLTTRYSLDLYKPE